MKIYRKIPFFESPDDSHCFQACFKMALSYWLPNKKFSMEKLDRISNHIDKKWTWQGSTILYLAKKGFKLINIENLDYEQFSKKGEEYLKIIWSQETFKIQKKYSDLKQEQIVAKKLINNKKITLYNREVKLSDILNLMRDNYTVLVSVNPYVFRNEIGYSSHMVVITSLTDTTVSFHDPGPPGSKNYSVSIKTFQKAMTKPAKEDGNMIGIKI